MQTPHASRATQWCVPPALCRCLPVSMPARSFLPSLMKEYLSHSAIQAFRQDVNARHRRVIIISSRRRITGRNIKIFCSDM